MKSIYFLSIHDQYVSLILSGQKQWEFRKNPRFGILPQAELCAGDIIFLIRTFPPETACHPTIDCLCRVISILRGEELHNYFKDKETGAWKESGCEDRTERGWEFFRHSILDVYSTGIKLIPYKVTPAIDVNSIQHLVKNTPWNGIGFTPMADLKRFTINGVEISAYFEQIAVKILKNTLNCPKTTAKLDDIA
jgi:hypothetical protein